MVGIGKGRGTSVEWLEQEDQFLRDHYGKTHSARQCTYELINPRTRNAVVGRAHRLGITSDFVSIGRPRTPTQQMHKIRERKTKNNLMKFKIKPWVDDVSLDLPDVVCEPVTFLDRNDDQCAWPLDSGMCCGRKTLWRKSYCAAHGVASVHVGPRYNGIWRAP